VIFFVPPVCLENCRTSLDYRTLSDLVGLESVPERYISDPNYRSAVLLRTLSVRVPRGAPNEGDRAIIFYTAGSFWLLLHFFSDHRDQQSTGQQVFLGRVSECHSSNI
jgi:hypothetical protein